MLLNSGGKDVVILVLKYCLSMMESFVGEWGKPSAVIELSTEFQFADDLAAVCSENLEKIAKIFEEILLEWGLTLSISKTI